MLIAEPPRSQGDVHFRLLDFPIRIHPFFWVAVLLLGYRPDGTAPLELIVWVVVVIVSIVVHELGHAVLQRRYGGRPRIVLYGFGGLAITDYVDFTPRRQIAISLAGPAAGLCLAGATLLVLWASGHPVGVQLGSQFRFEGSGLQADYALPLLLLNVYWAAPEQTLPDLVVLHLLTVNIYWSLLNLLPIYPLDGGRVSRELFTMKNHSTGIELSLQLSIATAAVIVLYALVHRRMFLALMLGYLAYTNYQTLRRYQGTRW